MLTNFENSYTGKLSNKFLEKQLLNIPPHLTCPYTTLLHVCAQKSQ